MKRIQSDRFLILRYRIVFYRFGDFAVRRFYFHYRLKTELVDLMRKEQYRFKARFGFGGTAGKRRVIRQTVIVDEITERKSVGENQRVFFRLV